MLKTSKMQRLMFLVALAGLGALATPFGCLKDVCGEKKTAAFTTMDDLRKNRILSLRDALTQNGVKLSPDQEKALARDGQLLGAVSLKRPVKHPNGTVEMPSGWLPSIPAGHPWKQKLSPRDDAYYSFVEERIFRARLFDTENPEHMAAANAYLAKANSTDPRFMGWTYAIRTECEKRPCSGSQMECPDAGLDADF